MEIHVLLSSKEEEEQYQSPTHPCDPLTPVQVMHVNVAGKSHDSMCIHHCYQEHASDMHQNAPEITMRFIIALLTDCDALPPNIVNVW